MAGNRLKRAQEMEFTKQGGAVAEADSAHDTSVVWRVVDMPDKGGAGVLATASIAVGACISAESEMNPEEYETRFKFNHSCIPNAHSCADVKGKSTRYVFALRAIEEGEEILISYCPTWWPYAQRHKELKAKFDFECGCEACVEGEARDARERGLAACMTLFDMVPSLMQAKCPREALKMAHTRMDLLLHLKCSVVEVAQAAYDAFQMAAAAGMGKVSRAFVKYSYECRMLALGPHSAETKEAAGLLNAAWSPMPGASLVVPPALLHNICAYCGKNGAKSTCGVCSLAYCDRTCQTTAWADHKKLCKCYKRPS